MKRSNHRRMQTSSQVNLPMIATKCLQHPVQQQAPLSTAKITMKIEKKTLNNNNNSNNNNLNKPIIPSLPSTTTVSRRSSQFSKSKPFLVKRKEAEITENRIIVNVGQMKKRNSIGIIQSSKKTFLLKGKRKQKERENLNPKTTQEQEETDKNQLPFQLKTQENKLKHPDLEFLFNKDYQNTLDAKLAKPYHLDGDIGMYTKEALKKRKDLKSFENVQIAINRFIDDCFSFDKQQLLSKINYLAAFFKISLILRNDLSEESPEDYEEIKKILEEDWQRDSKGTNKITREQLFNSLFELADVWTPGIDASQCVSFFETLRYKFAIEGVKPKINIYDILS